MIVLGIDSATQTGWAVHDTDKHPSSIISGSYGLPAKDENGVPTTIDDRLRHIRRTLAVIVRTHQPTFCAIEQPWFGSFGDKEPSGAASGVDPSLFSEGNPPPYGHNSGAKKSKSNPHSTAVVAHICGATKMLILGLNIPMVSVAKNTWSTIIPKNLRVPKQPKKSVENYCNFLRIVSPNEDSRDAAVIAIWGAGAARDYRVVR